MTTTRHLTGPLVAMAVGTVVGVGSYLCLMFTNTDDAVGGDSAGWLSWPHAGFTALFGAFVGLLASMAWERIAD